MAEYEGRLELTWTNKDHRLLAHDDGSYEWVSSGDFRVAEVRLFRNVEAHGATAVGRSQDNLLIQGDALHALTSLASLPEFSSEYLGRVKLAYLDPPFNTGQAFEHYDDALEHSVWLTMMRDRLVQVRNLLAENGSVWIHLDDSEMAYCRVMADEIFGRDAFIGCVVWEKTYTPKSNGRGLSTDHDYILVYAKNSSTWFDNGWNYLPRTAEQEGRFANPDNDPRGPWRTYPLDVRTDNSERRESYRYEVETPSGRIVRPASGRHWSLPLERFNEEQAAGLIFFGKNGDAMPTKKVFLSEARAGVLARSWWSHKEVGSSQEAKKESKALNPGTEPFATPKPKRLLERVLSIASNPGDIVLDCFVGSGTTADVATRMGRRWLAIERSRKTLNTYTLPRLKNCADQVEPEGVGRPGFRVLEVAPSMFEEDGGLVFLTESMTNGQLAEATAAQLGYAYEPSPPFAGRKGRNRLAVVDGIASEGVVRILVNSLDDDERVVVCGTGIDPQARQVLKELRPGSTLRKIPAALLASYRYNRPDYEPQPAPSEPMSQT